MGIERIGVYDNFFDLEGHSLLITQIASRLNRMFHMEIPLRTLFEGPTIAEMTTFVAQTLAKQIEMANLDDHKHHPDDVKVSSGEI